ncbi:MAG: L,D-transpeptidase [Acidimicrobiales bacterium]
MSSGWRSVGRRAGIGALVVTLMVAAVALQTLPGSAAAPASPFGYLDSAISGPAGVTVSGWATDPDTAAPLDVHLYRNDEFMGAVRADDPRPDVAAAHPWAGPNHGYSQTIAGGEGTQRFCAYAINVGAGDPYALLGCTVVRVTNDAVGVLDAVSRVPGTDAAQASGWAVDANSADPVDIHYYVDNAFVGVTRADQHRADIAANLPWSGGDAGYSFIVPVGPGSHDVCAYAIGIGPGSPWSLLGCRSVEISSTPVGVLESARVGDNQLRVNGWALDPDVTSPVEVHFWIDGYFAGSVPASDQRDDVAALFPGYGPQHGFGATLWLWPQAQNVCAYAINAGPGPGYVGLGCRPLASAAPPDSGTGRRVVYANLSQRVWLVEADGFVAHSYPVSGKYLDPSPGVYQVYAYQRHASAGHDNITMEYFVAFNPAGLGYGFHTIPVYGDGTPLQSESELGFFRSAGCVRQRRADAVFMWNWAQIGDPVVVLAS